ncbi:MAG TPA: tetratricopeptide repeat protein [Oligoflexia bacterium]|nr:tetratricopeptide repeat protein [Oligoflexia bacterium]
MKTFSNQYILYSLFCISVILFTVFCYFQTSKGAIITHQARIAYLDGRISDSYLLFDKAFKESKRTNNRRLLLQLAILNKEMKRFDKAIDAYISYFNSLSKVGRLPSLDSIKELIFLYRMTGSFNSAIDMIKSELIWNKYGNYLKDDLLGLYIEQGLYVPAIKLLDNLINDCYQLINCTKKNKANTINEYEISRAELLALNKQFNEAIISYKKLSVNNPGVKEKLAEVLSWKGDFLKSAEILGEILKEESHGTNKYYKILSKRVTLLYWGGEGGIADEIISSNPYILEYDKSLSQMSISYKLGNQEFLEAEILLKNEIKKLDNPDNLQAERLRLKLAEVLSWQGRYDESLALYDSIIKNHPDDIQLRRNYAAVLSWAGRHSESVKQLKSTLEN